MKLTLIANKQALGILGFIPLGKYGATLYPIGWGFWSPKRGAFGVIHFRTKGWALLDYVDYHPESPWHLLDEVKN